jgi:PIN domain nuclease of toxin-antitoxin system
LKVLLDTHVWVWWLLPESPLTVRERHALDKLAEDKHLALPAICMWELQMLHYKQRVRLPLPLAPWLKQATSPDVITVLPLNAETVLELDALPKRFHGDPADRMIVAAARLHQLPLATHDRSIRSSRLVKIWRP